MLVGLMILLATCGLAMGSGGLEVIEGGVRWELGQKVEVVM